MPNDPIRLNVEEPEEVSLSTEEIRVVEAVSPTVNAERNAEGVKITVHDLNGTRNVQLFDGIGSVVKTGTDGLVDTYTITWKDGSTSTFALTNGRGISGVSLNADYTLTITLNDGTSYTTDSIRGEKGEKGDKGDKGDRGEQGEQGIQGLKGDKGNTGDKGDKGEKGDQGVQGVQGVQGPKGDKGDAFEYSDFTEAQKADLIQGPIAAAQSAAVTAVNQAGTAKVGEVNNAGAAQVALVEAKGEEVLDSIPADYSDLAGQVSNLNSAIKLLDEMIMDTVQAISFDQSGNVSQITHSRNGTVVRTDAFTFGTNTITEVRTLAATGESVTIVTNTTTLETTVTYAAA